MQKGKLDQKQDQIPVANIVSDAMKERGLRSSWTPAVG
jgi:hypothetical protein